MPFSYKIKMFNFLYHFLFSSNHYSIVIDNHLFYPAFT